jgi:hypothetical protein
MRALWFWLPWMVLCGAGCAPALDWREVRPDGSGATALFPCKPTSQSRQVRLAASQVQLVLVACAAGDATWALAHADVLDPSLVAPALVELRAAAASNLSASSTLDLPLKVEGATPNPMSQRVHLTGRLPDGKAVNAQVAVFAKGTRVFQATLIGTRWPADAPDTFFSSLRLRP